MFPGCEVLCGVGGAVWVFQDNASAHNFQPVGEWLDRNGIARDATFPPRSPDLNLIENVFALMTREVQTHAINSENQLISAIVRAWSLIDVVTIQRLYGSWRARVAAVIAAGGGYTKY